MILVSIIVPFYNSEENIRRCINSIVNQTYANLEIILVDDGSTDNSLTICEKYSKRDTRILTIHKKNEGVSIARNTGIDSSHGEWITFVDSDDWLERDFISVLLEHSKDADIIISNCTKNKEYYGEDIYDYVETYAKSISGTACHHKIIRSSLIKNNRVYFASRFNYGEDTLFSLNLLQYCNGIKLLEYQGYHFTHSDILVSEKYNQSIEDINEKIIELESVHNRLTQRFKKKFDITYDIKMTIMMFPMMRIVKGEDKTYEMLWQSYFPNTSTIDFYNDRYCSPLIRSITYMKSLSKQHKYYDLYIMIKRSHSLWGDNYLHIEYPYSSHRKLGLLLGSHHLLTCWLSFLVYAKLKS